ncbi:hypothetical protein GcM1_135008 [Golovinomyces cichoracearum]|uniref:Uncharacterized protein n=1 Tax=Golovinomyces cichoracearum TaxID=62708 RepID=A0A420JBN1_9PEZI|nr:hypothetical protein GcM1_135008 [Golovinomyces cichoracearum]
MSLDSQYKIVNLKLDASIKFDKLYQRKTPFPNFIVTFQSLATRCGKTEEQKVKALKRKVADEIAQQFRGLDRPPASDDFSEYEHNLKTKGKEIAHIRINSTKPPHQGGDEMDLDQVTLFNLTEKEKTIVANIIYAFTAVYKVIASGNVIGNGGSHGTRSSRGGFQTPRLNLNHRHNDRFTWAQGAQENWRGSTSQRTGFNRGGFNLRGHQGFQPSLRGGLFRPRNKPNQNGVGQLRAVESENEWQEEGEHAPHPSYLKHEYSFPYTNGYNFDDVRHSENS